MPTLFDQLRNIDKANFTDLSRVDKFDAFHSSIVNVPVLIGKPESSSIDDKPILICDSVVCRGETPEASEYIRVAFGGSVLMKKLQNPDIIFPIPTKVKAILNDKGKIHYYDFDSINLEEYEFIMECAKYHASGLE